MRGEPYEEYQRYVLPDHLAQRVAELKLYLAFLADGSAWRLDELAGVTSSAADALLLKIAIRDAWDWNGVLDSYRQFKAENIGPLLARQ
jgi:hypothetical protein